MKSGKTYHRRWRWQGGAVTPRPLPAPVPAGPVALVATWVGSRLVVRPAITPTK